MWARGGKGALVPSCRAPHGHDLTPKDLCVLQKNSKTLTREQVDDYPTCDATRTGFNTNTERDYRLRFENGGNHSSAEWLALVFSDGARVFSDGARVS